MKNIKIHKRERYEDKNNYQLIEKGIYKALQTSNELVESGDYVMSIAFELEEKLGETVNRQYPIEDILEKYSIYVSDTIKDNQENKIVILELSSGSDVMEIIKLKEIVGKRVYNKTFTDSGQTYQKLIIE